jgi:hypothetical protein
MYSLYRVKYNAFAVDMLGITGELYTYQPSNRYHEIIETIPTPFKMEFISSYSGEDDFDLLLPSGDSPRISYCHTVPPYEGGHWNYTEQEYMDQIAGSLNIPHLMGGDVLPEDVFAVFKLIHPDAKRGFYNHATHKWELVKDTIKEEK